MPGKVDQHTELGGQGVVVVLAVLALMAVVVMLLWGLPRRELHDAGCSEAGRRGWGNFFFSRLLSACAKADQGWGWGLEQLLLFGPRSLAQQIEGKARQVAPVRAKRCSERLRRVWGGCG